MERSKADQKVKHAESEFQKGNNFAAVILYSEIIGNDSRNIEYLNRRSECLMKLNEYSFALKDALLSIEINKNQQKIHERLIEINLRLGKINDVESLIKQFETSFQTEKIDEKTLTKYNDVINAQQKLNDSFESGNFEDCLKNVNKLLLIAIACEDAKFLKTEILVLLNCFKKARSFFRKNFESDEHNAFLKALISYYQGDFESCKDIVRLINGDFDGNKTFKRLKDCMENDGKSKILNSWMVSH